MLLRQGFMLLDHFKIEEHTQPLSPSSPTWNGSCGFCLEIKQDYDKMFRVHQVKMHAGVGTHMGAPSHRFEGGMSIADIPVERFVVPLCVIDVSQKAGANYEVSVALPLRAESTESPIRIIALVPL